MSKDPAAQKDQPVQTSPKSGSSERFGHGATKEKIASLEESSCSVPGSSAPALTEPSAENKRKKAKNEPDFPKALQTIDESGGPATTMQRARKDSETLEEHGEKSHRVRKPRWPASERRKKGDKGNKANLG